MTKLARIAAILVLLAPVATSAQVFRCSHEGVTVFSDQPCGLNPEQVAYSEKISFIKPDENLPEQAEANRLFVQARQNELAERRRRAKKQQERAQEPHQTIIENHHVHWPPATGFWNRRHRHHYRHDGPQAPTQSKKDYSALNGPILGTRPESAAFSAQRYRSSPGKGSKRRGVSRRKVN
ncbi:MAG TPA: DUF4124 domain-containing protein [Wenzhouxiangella sp.]|nr:DUF4124 domain-containing protein [Wenzhouxiangella sp.]